MVVSFLYGMEITSWSFRVFHGMAFGKKLLGWKALASRGLMPDFDYAIAGHWHTPTTMYVNDVRLWVNGSQKATTHMH